VPEVFVNESAIKVPFICPNPAARQLANGANTLPSIDKFWLKALVASGKLYKISCASVLVAGEPFLKIE